MFLTFYGDGYSYGFQGQEKDNEIAGEGNSYTAEFWQYDSRLGRRWNLDPKPNVSISSYATFANNPIFFTDHKGDTINFPVIESFEDFGWNFQSDLNKIYQTKTGKALIRSLHSSEVYINIEDGSRWYLLAILETNETREGRYDIGSPDLNNSVTVEYSQNSSDVSFDGIKYDSFIILAHELVHARDIANGFDKKVRKLVSEGLELPKFDIQNELYEVRAMIVQNMIAKELGLNTVRTSYGGVELLQADGITPIKDYGFDITEGLELNIEEDSGDGG